MDTLREVVRKYLEANGITVKFFADFIGCRSSQCSLWLSGKRRLNSEQIKKVHEFLTGDFLKSVNEIM